MATTKYDIPVGFYFEVKFDIESAGAAIDTQFQEVAGLSSELGIETYDEGGENRFSHRLPNRGKFNNLTLKRGLLVDGNLKNWFENAIQNFTFEPSNVTVILKTGGGDSKQVDSWVFYNAWPVKWSISDFKAQDNALVIETVELAYQHFERDSPKKDTDAASVPSGN